MPTFFDTHAHLDFPEFAADLPEVLERAAAAGIQRVITVGTSLESSRRATALSDAHPGIYAAVGWHPGDAMAAPADVRVELRELAQHPKVVAIGETGLDFYRLPSKQGAGSTADDEAYQARQLELFRQHLEVAAELGLACVIHQRDAFEEVLAALAPFADRVRCVFHCFTLGPEAAQRVLELGALVSFTGVVTFKNAGAVRQTVAAVPEGRLMLETDCPYLAPAPDRGKRCEPAHVRKIAEVVAEVRRCGLETLSAVTCETARGFFGKLG